MCSIVLQLSTNIKMKIRTLRAKTSGSVLLISYLYPHPKGVPGTFDIHFGPNVPLAVLQ